MSTAIFKTQPYAMSLHNFNEVSVLKIVLDYGTWVVFGRAVIGNYDGDPQNAHAKLRAFGAGDIIDYIDVRISDDACAESVKLQGIFKAEKGQQVEMVCETYKGNVHDGSLIAIQVDSAHPSKD